MSRPEEQHDKHKPLTLGIEQHPSVQDACHLIEPDTGPAECPDRLNDVGTRATISLELFWDSRLNGMSQAIMLFVRRQGTMGAMIDRSLERTVLQRRRSTKRPSLPIMQLLPTILTATKATSVVTWRMMSLDLDRI